jgi:hypothetical protein
MRAKYSITCISVIYTLYLLISSRDSSVGMATILRAGRPGFDSRQEQFSLRYRIQTGPEAYPASYPMGTGRGGGLSLGVKWRGIESDNSPLSNAEVKNSWSYNSTPPYVFMAWCLVKYRIRFHGAVLG